jgi:AraC-like DNA-binding protein
MTDLIAGSALLQFQALVSSLGGDPDSLMRAQGLDPSAAGNFTRLLPYTKVAAAIGEAAAALQCPDFGMRLARRQGIQIMGPVAVLIRHAETVAAAIEGVVRNNHHCAPPELAKLTRGPRSAVFSFDVALRQFAHREQMVEKGLCLAMEAFCLMLGDDFVPLRVTFQHDRVAPASAYQEIFRGSVDFGCELNSVHLPLDSLARPIRGRDPAALALAERHLAYAGAALPVTDHVRELIHHRLKTGHADLLSIAQTLVLHPRVLQRRLAESGTSFEDILDDVRHEMAWQLSARGLQVSQIATMLGYSEQSSYTRACRRWFGESPRQLIARCRKTPLSAQSPDRISTATRHPTGMHYSKAQG